MKSLFILLLTFYSTITFSAEIYDIDLGRDDQEAMILLTNGRVIFTQDKSNLKNLIRKQSKIKSLSTDQDEDYQPTLIEGLNQAQAMFKSSRQSEKKSECFNRAHVWSYEWFKDHGVFSEKIWIFFSRKYIRKFKFEWWFHVAPLLKIKEGEHILERVMDIKYLSGPQNISRWTDFFMRNKETCLTVSKYSDYANYPESAWCHIMKTNMFFYQPIDIEWREVYGLKKSNWNEDELKTAFLDALNENI